MYTHRNIMINKAGGNAGSTSKNYRISIPVDMIRELGITEEDRGVILICEDGKITIKKSKGIERDKKEMKVKRYDYFNGCEWGKISESALPGVELKGLEEVHRDVNGITCVYKNGEERYYNGTSHGDYIYQSFK